MKKVLIIANLFHASPRIPGIATYLPEFGWKVAIITPPFGSNTKLFKFSKQFFKKTKIFEASYRGDIFWFWRRIFKLIGFKTNKSITEQVKKEIGATSQKSFIDVLMNWYQTIFAYPDTEKTWKKPALKVANSILEKQYFDVILSSSPFPTSHIIAAKLKEKFNLPWVADFRDLWTQNHNYQFGPIRKYFEKKLEIETLKSADALVTVSPFWVKKLGQLHKKNLARIITNGFDPEKINVPAVSLTNKFTVTYTGAIYARKQDPLNFFIALKELIDEKKINQNDIEVRFFGLKKEWLEKEIKKYKLSAIIRQYGLISREESLNKQRESQILLLLNWEDKKEKGVCPLKTFEYLSAKRPILATGGFSENDIEKIINKTEAGIYAPTVEKIENALFGFYKEYKTIGKVAFKGNLEEINKYSYREMARKFADVLNQTTKKYDK